MSKPVSEDSEARALGRATFDTGDLRNRPLIAGKFVIPLFGLDEPVAAGIHTTFLRIPPDLDATALVECSAGGYTTGGSELQLQIINHTQSDVDMLTTTIRIDAGETDSKDSSPQPVIDQANHIVAWGDVLVFDVVADGGVTGLDLSLVFA